MPYSQKNNPMKMMKSALKMYKDDKKSGMHRDSAMYMKHGMHRDSSMYMKDGMHRESAELKDMPIVDIEKGDAKGSPAKAAKPDFPDIDGDRNTTESMKKAAADKKKGSPAKNVGEEKPHGTYADQGLIKSYKKGDKYIAIDKSVHDTYEKERAASGKALTRAKKKAREARKNK